MKKIIFSLCLVFLITPVFAQNGLENIIVEKYYVSDEEDSIGSSGDLPVGSVTYRIFVDMLPGYNFQMAYGSPSHPLLMTTTTSFFNNTDYGNFTPVYSKHNASKNTVMLDSWLSTGGACSGEIGVPKSADSDGSIAHDLLQNDDIHAGIPLTTADGMIPGTVPAFNTIGFTNETDVFNDGTANGNTFATSNGAWSCQSGAKGPDSATNIVLIAQITTNGTFHYELNIQIGKDLGGGQSLYEKYVTSNSVGPIERTIPGLTGTIDLYTGIKDVKTSPSAIKIYPNPAKNAITLDIASSRNSKHYSFAIVNMEGKMILNKYIGTISGKHLENINISSLVSGQYIIVLLRDGIKISSQIITKQ